MEPSSLGVDEGSSSAVGRGRASCWPVCWKGDQATERDRACSVACGMARQKEQQREESVAFKEGSVLWTSVLETQSRERTETFGLAEEGEPPRGEKRPPPGFAG